MIAVNCDLNIDHKIFFLAWINVINSKPRIQSNQIKVDHGPWSSARGWNQVSSSVWGASPPLEVRFQRHAWVWGNIQRWDQHRCDRRWSSGLSLKGISPKSWSWSLIATVGLASLQSSRSSSKNQHSPDTQNCLCQHHNICGEEQPWPQSQWKLIRTYGLGILQIDALAFLMPLPYPVQPARRKAFLLPSYRRENWGSEY